MGNCVGNLFYSFIPNIFKVCKCFYRGPEDVHMLLELSSKYFYTTFSTFLTFFFSDPISIRKDTLWAQLFLEFSTDHFETMHTCYRWSEDVRLI